VAHFEHAWYNGNNPHRHREFLRGLAGLPGKFSFSYTHLDPCAHPKARITLDTFLTHLVVDTGITVDLDPDDGIEITVSAARTAEDPDIIWNARYSQQWDPESCERIHTLLHDQYGWSDK